MDFKAYQEAARTTRMGSTNNSLNYSILGLVGEAGEVANKYKKIVRGENEGVLKEEIKGEMGDVLWYLAAMADDLNVSLADIAQQNIDKLQSRYARNKIQGSGDNR